VKVTDASGRVLLLVMVVVVVVVPVTTDLINLMNVRSNGFCNHNT
jgi:hypothetical protein